MTREAISLNERYFHSKRLNFLIGFFNESLLGSLRRIQSKAPLSSSSRKPFKLVGVAPTEKLFLTLI